MGRSDEKKNHKCQSGKNILHVPHGFNDAESEGSHQDICTNEIKRVVFGKTDDEQKSADKVYIGCIIGSNTDEEIRNALLQKGLFDRIKYSMNLDPEHSIKSLKEKKAAKKYSYYEHRHNLSAMENF